MSKKLQIKSLHMDESQPIMLYEEFAALDFSVEDCDDMFQDAKDLGIIYKCEFGDKTWYLIGNMGNDLRPFEFDEELEFEQKCFVLLLVTKAKLNVNYIHRIFAHISKFYKETNGFDPDYATSVVDATYYESNLLNWIARFLCFIQHEHGDEIANKITNYRTNPNQPRLLPVFYSVFVFDHIINDYFANKNHENQFYPIYLWWKLSSILPLRPVEFLTLDRKCLSTKKRNGQTLYYISINRAKQRQVLSSSKTMELVKQFPIPFELWACFEKYINMANTIDNNIYVFSKKVFDDKANTHQQRRERNYIGADRFYYLMDWFYKELESQYNIKFVTKGTLEKYDTNEIERINMGDTRHIAICDLMLQGVNPIKIAQMAGHRSVETQMGYCSHYSDYITSKTRVLHAALSGNLQLRNNSISFDNKPRSSILRKEMLGSSFYSLPKVDGGRCTSKCFPNECPLDGCYFCHRLIPDSSIDVERIKQYELMLNKEIETKINYLQLLVRNSIESHIQEIQTKELELGSIFNQKMWIESYRYLKENNLLKDTSRMIEGDVNNE